ncbi:hypothetical protein J6590_087361 [Homalodisca vitripennis]|nr:hypothetical protein J6590_087361 [Homalodisca vitripennis]
MVGLVEVTGKEIVDVYEEAKAPTDARTLTTLFGEFADHQLNTGNNRSALTDQPQRTDQRPIANSDCHSTIMMAANEGQRCVKPVTQSAVRIVSSF